ncbi:DUF58 domain-containing protein [Halovivax gelatinilyticus]|uniref:DUF58 domain-containing protein n=1 Tax=Halovivax gelatinilyticus TaxID=2961597 RepID=UPI0020CA9B93|nr:DUF58 domain-containing protein [Halovivax gelatinilyticus]
MRPTPRAIGALAVLGVLVAHGFYAGPRSLNAIVVPLAVVTVAGAVSVAVAGRPTVARRPIGAGYVGERRSVVIDVETGRAVTATVTDEIGPGLRRERDRSEYVLEGATTVEYDVQFLERGERTIGPLSIEVTDLFGLFRRRFDYEKTEPVVVYPPVYELTPSARRELTEYANTAREFDRAVFEQLREYERGDSLRDVHWKSAARNPDDELVVKEFVADDGLDRVSLTASCPSGDDDELAAATATVVDHLLELDVGVVLRLPGEVRIEVTPDRRSGALEALALFDGAATDPTDDHDPDLRIDATDDGITVDFGRRAVDFFDLCTFDGSRSSDATARRTTDANARAESVTTARNGDTSWAEA